MIPHEIMNDEKLIRGIGRWDLTAIVINTIIGAGIFGLPSKVYAQLGSYSLFAFAACALIIGLIVLCHAEVASRFTATGGAYLYAKQAFGSTMAFEVGWLYWIVRMATFAANCNLLINYLSFFWVPATNPLWLHDLVPAPGYRAAVAGLGPPPTGIVEQDARGLLGTLLP